MRTWIILGLLFLGVVVLWVFGAWFTHHMSRSNRDAYTAKKAVKKYIDKKQKESE